MILFDCHLVKRMFEHEKPEDWQPGHESAGEKPIGSVS
jgi:hypothetical protein